MSREANVAAQEHLAGNINAGNVDLAVETFAEDAVDHDPAPGQGPGREGFRTFWKTLTAGFPDAHIEPRHEVADDDHVVVAYTLTGTHDGEFEGVAPTGKRIEITGIQIGRFEDGKLVGALGQLRRARHHAADRRGLSGAAGRGSRREERRDERGHRPEHLREQPVLRVGRRRGGGTGRQRADLGLDLRVLIAAGRPGDVQRSALQQLGDLAREGEVDIGVLDGQVHVAHGWLLTIRLGCHRP
jgi:steroid delta-isomerase-like uncharacterized protein